MRNFAQRFAMGLPDAPDRLPPRALSLPQRLAQFEAQVIRDVLASVGGNTAEATELLGIPRKTLYDTLVRLDISLVEFRP